MAKAVIMAGGQGERFWPLTHHGFPKYRIRLDGKISLLQGTYERLSQVYPRRNIHVVTTQEHVRFVREELPRLGAGNLIVEPFRNNTATAIYFSCMKLGQRHGWKKTVSFFPADHLIQDAGLFKKTMRSAVTLASRTDFLVTIGIRPTFPATGYGYIESGKALRGAPGGFRVARFVEKPNRKRAARYLKKKTFYWNGGIFTWRIDVFLSAMEKYAPEFKQNFNLERVRQSYSRLRKRSIDHALLERADNLVVLKTGMDWCDIGSWGTLFGSLGVSGLRVRQTKRGILITRP